MAGSGELTLTGSLGDVIKESARIALGWIKSHASQCGVAAAALDKTDLHIHFPAGAVGKDGPSGGIALAVAIVSCLTRRRARHDTAMTGEITLTGTVLPVGGVKQKVLAAHAAGIRRIIMPRHNAEHDLAELPPRVRDDLEFIPVAHLDEALQHAFADEPAALSKL